MKRTVLAALLACAWSQAQTPAPPAKARLEGLWGARPVFGPVLQGDMWIRQGAAQWTLQIGGQEFAVAPPAKGAFHWVLPEGLGALRGRYTQAGLEGFWIQPPSESPAYATPVRFASAGPGVWRGFVTPLAERLSLYLNITAQPDGTLRGSFHNPEMRWNGGAPWFKVIPEQGALRLVDPASGKTRFLQGFDEEQRRISMDFGSPFFLTPLTPAQAVGFRPRASSAPYFYRVPPALGDGWSTASARKVGLDPKRLEALVRRILAAGSDQRPDETPKPLIHSLLVARRGQLVLEEYFFGHQASDTHDLRSASKSLTSLMVGVAMDQHPTIRIDTPITKAFGVSPSGDPRKDGITLGHALTHSTGLASDDSDPNSPGNEDLLQRSHGDWDRFMLDLPLTATPGTRYAYSSGGLNLALGAVARLTGRWAPEWFDATLARPMGIHQYHMNLMPDGEAYGGGGMHMRPRDLLKFGQLLLQEGRWQGKQLVSRAWIKASTAHQITTADGGSDGYGWHRHRLLAGGKPVDIIEANGNGGQFLIVVPSQQLAIVFTAGNYNQYGVWRTFRESLVPDFILLPHP